MPLSSRENLILNILDKSRLELSATELFSSLAKKDFAISKITLNRDLKNLEKLNLISKLGKAKATKYKLSTKYKIFKEINFAEYFSVDFDDRKVLEEFNFEIFENLSELFTKEEKQRLDELNSLHLQKISYTSSVLLKKELERLMIELSWKSSKLEGNTYTLLDTEFLLKEKLEAKNHTKEEAIMILNHKSALDYIYKNKHDFKSITPSKVIQIHELLTKDLDINPGFRTRRVGILGTKYKPLENTDDINKAISLSCDLINSCNYPLEKTLSLIALMSYIQAFEDGNKRTARILSTAILLAYDYCPISYRKVDDYDYKKSIIIFYEQNNIVFLKKLFMMQFEFAVHEYF
jgi:Fic family protein